MKFAEIIGEAGINPSDIPNVANLLIILYDENRQKHTKETIHYDNPLFEENFKARINFLKFLVDLEAHLRQNPDLATTLVLHIQITEVLVVVGSGVMVPLIFPRKLP